MILADIDFGEGLLLVFEFFLFFAWISILFMVIADLFRDHELSGWWKAVWVFVLIFVPFFGVLVYLIARGGGMRERSVREQADAKQHFDSYIREQADAASPAEELGKLAELRDKGILSTGEFETAKAKLLA